MKPATLRTALVLSLSTLTACAWAADERPASGPAASTSAASADGRAPPAPVAPAVREESAAAPGVRDNDTSRTIGTTIDDATITAKVKTALFTDELTKARNINVDTMRSVVTLRGIVHSQAEADRALRIARTTEGVASVKSELRVAH